MCSLRFDRGFIAETVIIACLSVGALICNIVSLRAIRESGGALPVNVKTWLSNYGVAFTIRSVYFVSKSCYYVTIVAAATTTTSNFPVLGMNRLICIFHESFNLTTICVAQFSLMLVSFDRLSATLHKNKLRKLLSDQRTPCENEQKVFA
uniref:7TM GPCR serpentine receptor class x (Srx) domain-containing protein n=1 Tax=Romanomermis culicivorax TaxID=13658 RepID=A0A915KLQ0_ROMCU